jgi:hypothetical protein
MPWTGPRVGSVCAGARAKDWARLARASAEKIHYSNENAEKVVLIEMPCH